MESITFGKLVCICMTRFFLTSDPILRVTRTAWSKHQQQRHCGNETNTVEAYKRNNQHTNTHIRSSIHANGVYIPSKRYTYVAIGIYNSFHRNNLHTTHNSTSSSTDEQHQHKKEKRYKLKSQKKIRNIVQFFFAGNNFVFCYSIFKRTIQLIDEKFNKKKNIWKKGKQKSIVIRFNWFTVLVSLVLWFIS